MAATLVGDLVDRVQRLVDRVDPTFRTRVVTALDEAVQWFSQRAPWDGLLEQEDFYTDGTEFLVLPDRIQRVIWIADVANSRHVRAGGHFEKRNSGPFLQQTAGSACEWRPLGLVPVIKQPSGETLTLSTTVSEALQVEIRGLLQDTSASGTALEFYEARETITMAGAAAASSNTYHRIISLQKQKDGISDLTVTRTTTGDQIARIPSWAARPLYPRIQLLFKPTAGTQLRFGIYLRPDRITAESDAIDPAINEEAIMWRAAGNLHWIENEGQQAQLAWQKAEEIVNNVKNVEETFGEKDYSLQPGFSYLDQEGAWRDVI